MTSSYADPAFFKHAIIYQIYPASFCDSNADGFGDLKGIQSKLDYLQSLGVDVLWLSPIYKSPLKDMGYDISDYKEINNRYGTLQDWDDLVADLHFRGMKIMMDLVVNHTSDQHEWFLASRESKSNNPKRDWYYWRPPKYGVDGTRHPPNNWASVFGGSAWEWDETTQEYYLHLYDPGQPDLNWENVEVRDAVWEMMLWWLDRGTDGFRMDVINLISKTRGLPDAEIFDPVTPWQPGQAHFVNGPKVHEYLMEMNRRVLSKYPDAVTVGETPWTHDPKTILKYIHPDRKELHMVFNFELADLDSDVSNPLIPVPYTLPAFKRLLTKWQIYMHENNGWNSCFFENHDLARSVSRFLGFSAHESENTDDSDAMRSRGAKLLSILQTTLGGTLYVYQGQELGLANVPKTWGIEEYKDVASINFYKEILDRRSKKEINPDMSDVLEGINRKARDNARTPMQWNSSAHAGFTSDAAQPWMRVNSDYKAWNVVAQEADPTSVLAFWKTALSVRKANDIMTYGDFLLLSADHTQIFAYTRTLKGIKALVILNFSMQEVHYNFSLPNDPRSARLLLSNVKDNREPKDVILADVNVTLSAYEGRVYITVDT